MQFDQRQEDVVRQPDFETLDFLQDLHHELEVALLGTAVEEGGQEVFVRSDVVPLHLLDQLVGLGDLVGLDLPLGERGVGDEVGFEAALGHHLDVVLGQRQIITLDRGVEHGVEGHVVGVRVLALQHGFEEFLGGLQVLFEIKHFNYSGVEDCVGLDVAVAAHAVLDLPGAVQVVVFDAAVEERALGHFVDAQLVVNEILFEDVECLVNLPVHALPFYQNTKGNRLRVYFFLDHPVVCINGTVHIFVMDAYINQTVE